MDFKEFYALLRTVADQRLSNLKKHENTEVFDTWKKINNVFDLYKTYRILLMMLSEHSVKNCVEISLEYLNSIHASIQKFSSHSMYTFPPATTCC